MWVRPRREGAPLGAEVKTQRMFKVDRSDEPRLRGVG